MIMKIFVWTRSCFTVHNYLRGPGQTLWRMELCWRWALWAGVSIHNLSPQRTGDCRQWSDEGTLGDSGDPPAVIYDEAQHTSCSPLLAAAAGWAGSVYLRILMANQDISDCNPPPCACEDSWESCWYGGIRVFHSLHWRRTQKGIDGNWQVNQWIQKKFKARRWRDMRQIITTSLKKKIRICGW